MDFEVSCLKSRAKYQLESESVLQPGVLHRSRASYCLLLPDEQEYLKKFTWKATPPSYDVVTIVLLTFAVGTPFN